MGYSKLSDEEWDKEIEEQLEELLSEYAFCGDYDAKAHLCVIRNPDLYINLLAEDPKTFKKEYPELFKKTIFYLFTDAKEDQIEKYLEMPEHSKRKIKYMFQKEILKKIDDEDKGPLTLDDYLIIASDINLFKQVAVRFHPDIEDILGVKYPGPGKLSPLKSEKYLKKLINHIKKQD